MNEDSPVAQMDGAATQGQTHPNPRILVADDEEAIRRLITVVLVDSGYKVDAAEDGAAAWEALQAKPYDLLITDHNMPKITGLDLVKNLRSASMSLPVVMVAGSLPVHELVSNPSLQVAAMLCKPFSVAALLDTVENVLRATGCPRGEQSQSQPSWNSQPSADPLWR
jgi:DNA-binding response OmpR family regulator